MAKRFHVYKVVFKYSRDLCSMIVSWSNSFCITYIPMVYVTPKIGKIFAFQELRHARQYSKYSRNFEIWEALTTSKPIPCDFQIADIVTANILNLYWKNVPEDSQKITGQHNHSVSKTEPPDGTVLCENLKLIERIYNE